MPRMTTVAKTPRFRTSRPGSTACLFGGGLNALSAWARASVKKHGFAGFAKLMRGQLHARRRRAPYPSSWRVSGRVTCREGVKASLVDGIEPRGLSALLLSI